MAKISKSSVVTITGGTGSFGSTMVRYLINKDISEIRIFSRDENKQDKLRNELRDSRVKFFIGDTRDPESVDNVINGSDFVFHAAALKQVPSCEFFPMQAVATNISGSDNVIRSSYKHEVSALVCLSTDKAVYPINAMGMSKALMEKVTQSYARNNFESKTKVSITRYGNVMMSRGSVIPLFIDQILRGNKITVTDKDMTRFMMSLSESVELVIHAFENSESGDLYVKKAPGCSVMVLIEALGEIFKKKTEIQTIGIRHGEKMAESLLSSEEKTQAIESSEYFKVPLDSRSLDYQIYFDKGQEVKNRNDPYTSSNTKQLTVTETIELLMKVPEFIEFTENIK